jgi:hypothetical protein
MLSNQSSAFAGTGTSATNASITLNSNGLAISVAAPGGGGAVNFSAGTASNNLQTVVFSNSNGVSFGLNGSTITASVNAGGGGAYTLRDWDNFGLILTMNQITNLTATGVTQRPIFFPLVFGGNLTWNRGQFELSKVTNSQNNQFTLQFGLYSFANSTSINLIASLQNVYDHSSASSASITGIRRFIFSGIGAAGSTITAGHYVGMMMFSAGAGGTSGINLSLRGGVTAAPPLGIVGAGTNNLTTATSALSAIFLRQFQGRYTTTTGAPPAAVALAAVQGWTTGGGVPYILLKST